MEDFDSYPQKPELVERNQRSNVAATVFSIVLFILVFLLFFGDELNFIIYLVVVLLFHELGHFVFMKIFGYQNVRMLFIPLMGAFVQGKKSEYSQCQSFVVTLAGPIPGIVVGSALLYYGMTVHSIWMVELSALFLILNLINLLPLDPLDGGQLFKLFIKSSTELFLMIFALISSLVLIVLGWFMSEELIMLFGFFMAFRVRALQKQYAMHKELRQEDVNYKVSYKLLSNRDFLKIKEVVLSHTPPLRKFVEQASEEESDPILASQVNNVLSTPISSDASFLFKIIVLVLWLGAFTLPYIFWLTIDFNWFFSSIYFDK